MSDTAVATPPPVTTTQTPPAERQTQREAAQSQKPKRQPPYVVIIGNDDDHTFAYVIEVLQRFCGHKFPEAMALSSRIHRTGQAAVWTGSREVAELKRDQIRGFGPDFYAEMTVRYPLSVRIEPLPQS